MARPYVDDGDNAANARAGHRASWAVRRGPWTRWDVDRGPGGTWATRPGPRAAHGLPCGEPSCPSPLRLPGTATRRRDVRRCTWSPTPERPPASGPGWSSGCAPSCSGPSWHPRRRRRCGTPRRPRPSTPPSTPCGPERSARSAARHCPPGSAPSPLPAVAPPSPPAICAAASPAPCAPCRPRDRTALPVRRRPPSGREGSARCSLTLSPCSPLPGRGAPRRSARPSPRSPCWRGTRSTATPISPCTARSFSTASG